MLPARALSQFGDDLVLIVLLLRVFASGHGPWSVTGLLLCAALPVVILAPVAGRLVDAVPFKSLAITAGLWQAGCCLALAAVNPSGRCTRSSFCSSAARSSRTQSGRRWCRRLSARTRSAA